MVSHAPVLLRQVVAALRPERRGTIVDGTVGLGGHARALLEAGAGRLIGIDRDLDALDRARDVLAPWAERTHLVHADFRHLGQVLDELGLERVDGVLVDLGVSSLHLDAPGRGFSFRRDEPLDMRMDRTSAPDAATWLRTVSESDLADVVFRFGEERYARRVARAVIRERDSRPIDTTGHLAAVVRRAVPVRGWQRIDPATRTFQAIRIAVNRELEALDAFVAGTLARLTVEGRLAVIAFHSLEDRIVKHTLRGVEHDGPVPVRVLTKKPIVPDDGEVTANPRARSARLRVAERTA
jgi:16S rRNA (cytosine1402-N4)-methyltransferase